MFNNDHISIDNSLVDFERSIADISHMRNHLYEINSIEEYLKHRGDLSQFLFKIEGNIQQIVNSLLQIQEINRQYYDSFASMKNNTAELNQSLIYYQREHELLQEQLSDCLRQNDYLLRINDNQEKYINELIEKLKRKEKRDYGCQFTKNPFINPPYDSDSFKSFNYAYNNLNEKKPFYTQQTEQDKRKSNKVEATNQMKQEEFNERIVNQPKVIDTAQLRNYTEESLKEQSKVLAAFNKANGSLDKRSQIDLGKAREMITDKSETDTRNCKDQTNSIQKEEVKVTTEEVPLKIRVQSIISRIYNKEQLLSQLKSQFGEDYIDKITSSKVNPDLIAKSEIAISEYDKAIKDQEKKAKDNEALMSNEPKSGKSAFSLKNYFMFNLLQEQTSTKQTNKKKSLN